ncbi:MAG: Ppx/GppA phosphatase family protein [Brevundimonas sp.]|jgi:exopolyphosphatase / guanosine-5'-triphosphate,3'-diphosphate pyrophosphatase|uniref:Ppx/GppA phosphatase family protein n=1 Tax=Brevundimonas sp. TaxID=1871086 RepID=UPI00391C70C5
MIPADGARERDSGPKIEARADVFGALDLGTNNCRLLIARPVPGGFRVVDSFSRIVRLGEGLSQSGQLSEAAMARTLEALRVCAERLARRNITSGRIEAVATQACRQAANGAAFIEKVRRDTGLKLRIIPAEEEARLAVQGCLNLLDPSAHAALIVDVGGGSTEVSWLRRRARGRFETVGWMSVPIGVVSLADMHPEPEDCAEAWFEAMVASMHEPLTAHSQAHPQVQALAPIFASGRGQLIGTSGAITSLAGIHLRLDRYRRDRVDGLRMTAAECRDATSLLLEMGREGRALEPCIGPERAELVMAGAAILEAVQRVWPSNRIRVADRGLREGLLMSLMHQAAGRRRPARG